MNYKKTIIFTAITSLVVLLVLGIFLFLNGSDNLAEVDSEVEQKEQIKVYYVPVTNYFSEKEKITKEELQNIELIVSATDETLISNLKESHQLLIEESPSSVISKINQEKRVGLLPWYEVKANLKTLYYEDVYFWEDPDNFSGDLVVEIEAPTDSDFPIFEPDKLVKINFLGDIMLSRHVNTQMNRYGFNYPWAKVKSTTASADITFANLETPVSDLFKSPAAGMSFIAPTKNIPYLKSAGINIVSVANNHSADFGYNVFKDNLNNLSESQIGVCGGGLSDAEARKPVIIEVSGLKFGFLCNSSIIGSLYATDNSAGVPSLKIEPWHRDDEQSIKKIENDIMAATKEADIVIVSPHWGVEYKHQQSNSQTLVAKRMIDAGADLIVGTHPHVVQGSEFYDNKYITYSLGNFIFDQEWSIATKQGTMLSAYFYSQKQVAANLHPIEISNYAQPEFVTGQKYKDIFNKIKSSSVNLF